MLYHLTFRTNRLVVPVAYQSCLQGLIYQLLCIHPEYSGFLHEEGYVEPNGKHFKMFCFSRLQGRSVYRNKTLLFPSSISFFLRTADPTQAAILQQALQLNETYMLNHQPIILKKLEISELDLDPNCTQLNIKMLSPITVHTTLPDGYTKYYTPLDDEFAKLVNQNYRNKWRSVFGVFPAGDIILSALSVASRDKIVTDFRKIRINAWNGIYLLKGQPEALKFLYHTGLGAKNSLGFGMFEIIH